MREHIREHHTNKEHYYEGNNGAISAREFFQGAFGDRPEWAPSI
jgi:hypothetical protein